MQRIGKRVKQGRFAWERVIAAPVTPHITGSKKQSEGRASLFDVRVNVIVMYTYLSNLSRKALTNF